MPEKTKPNFGITSEQLGGQDNNPGEKEKNIEFVKATEKLDQFLDMPLNEYMKKNNESLERGGKLLLKNRIEEAMALLIQRMYDCDIEKAGEILFEKMSSNHGDRSTLLTEFSAAVQNFSKSKGLYDEDEKYSVNPNEIFQEAVTKSLADEKYYSENRAERIFDLRISNKRPIYTHSFNIEFRTLFRIILENKPSREFITRILDKLSSEDAPVDSLEEFLYTAGDAFSGIQEKYNIYKEEADILEHCLLVALEKTTDRARRDRLYAHLRGCNNGRREITDHGVNYLGKNYDLAEYNSSRNFVMRLTPTGDVGIFNDETSEFLKYFRLADAEKVDTNTKIGPDLKDITYETFFLSNEEVSDEEKTLRLQCLEEFKNDYYQISDWRVFTKYNVLWNNFTFQEQGWFKLYAKKHNNYFPGNFEQRISEVGESFLRTFIGMEMVDNGSGEKLLDERAFVGQDVLNKFSDIALYAQNFLENYNRGLYNELIDKNFTHNFIIKLYKKATETVSAICERSLTSYTRGLSGLPGDALLKKKLNAIRADIMLFAVAYKESGLPLEAMQDTGFESVGAEELSDEDKNRLRELVVLNYGESEFGEKVVLPALEKGMNNPANRFYLLKNKEEIVGAFRIEDQGEKYYFGSFNMDPNAQTSGLGNAMLEKVIHELSKEKPIAANVEVDKPVAKYYIDKLGFTVKETLRNVAGTGVDGYTIEKAKDAAEENLSMAA